MNLFRTCLAVLLVSLAASSLLFAGGFQLNEVGARAMGQGGAFAARANDLSAMYYNPAGLAYQNGFGAYVGASMILPKSSWTSPTGTPTTDMNSQTFVPPNAYVGYGLKDGLSFGIGFFVPFGLGTEWPEEWAGRRLAVKTDLQSYMVNPTIAYKVNETFMIGAGFSWMYSKVTMEYRVQTFSSLAPPTPASSDGWASLDANGNAFGFNLGAIYKPMPKMSFGVSYRHTTETDLEGDATFEDMQALSSFFPGGSGKATITFPNQIFAGLSYDVSENLSLEFDYQWVGWSTYDSLIVELPTGPVAPLPPALGGPRPLQTTQRSEKAWNNTYLLRLGGEYRMKEWSFRLGFIYDATPQPNKTVEPMLPDANRYEGTIGLGYKFAGHWGVDVAYQFISFQDRTVTGPTTGDMNRFPGTYKSTANLFGLSLGYTM
jgi:long-chain fatty acid transport protein